MAIISQYSMFVWENDLENLGDLTRLQLVLDSLPDEDLMATLEKERGNGRDDYPVRPMWNLIIAMIVFGHDRFADVIRELNRNVQLRFICGFNIGKTPSAVNVSRFVANLEKHQSLINEIFFALVAKLCELLPDFGEDVAIDSKWVESLAKRVSKCKKSGRRGEHDAEYGKKEYKGRRPDGTEWVTVKSCFGFKLHVLVDANYELPLAYMVTSAACSDVVYGKELLKYLEKNRADIFKRIKHCMGDRAYDDTALIQYLEGLGIKAVIDKRDMWKDEIEREMPGYKGIYYNERGEVFCYAPKYGERHEMRPAGYDTERDCLRMKCPAKMYGITCGEAATCTHTKNIRIPLNVDERIFTQIARPSYKWKTYYNKRTSVERVFSRLDVSFGFEEKKLRGKVRMELLGSMALIIMNAMAVGRIREKKPELMRSLVKVA
jgi:hypothetical protein